MAFKGSAIQWHHENRKSMIILKSIVIHCERKFRSPSQVEAFRSELKKMLNLTGDIEILFRFKSYVDYKKFMKWRKNILTKKYLKIQGRQKR